MLVPPQRSQFLLALAASTQHAWVQVLLSVVARTQHCAFLPTGAGGALGASLTANAPKVRSELTVTMLSSRIAFMGGVGLDDLTARVCVVPSLDKKDTPGFPGGKVFLGAAKAGGPAWPATSKIRGHAGVLAVAPAREHPAVHFVGREPVRLTEGLDG